MKAMRTMADLKSDPRISEVNDERRDGMGLWAYANDRDSYFIEGGSDTGSYVQIHEDSLREVLKQANRIKHFSEFSESEKENLRRWAEGNRYNLKENPMKSKLFKEERMNPLVGTEGLHFIVTQDDAGDTVLHVFNSEDEADLYHGQLRGYGGVKRIGRLKGSKRLYLGSDIIAGVTRQFGAEPRMIRHDDKENPRDARASSRKEEYNDYDEWQRDAFAAGATQIVKVGDGLSAIRTKDGSMLKVDAEGYFDPRSRYGVKMRKSFINIGAWYMDSGTIYRHIIKNHPEFFAYENPVRPRKGESSRAFVSRCMGEEKMSFPEPKQRIAVCLSKSRRRRNPLESGATISDDEDINRQAAKMG